MGTGVDQHGQNVTEAATRAVKDAVARVCLIGLLELFEVRDRNSLHVDVLVACPRQDEVDAATVLEALPFGEKKLTVAEGGMIVHGHQSESMGDRSDEIIVANAAVTVSVDTDSIAVRA